MFSFAQCMVKNQPHYSKRSRNFINKSRHTTLISFLDLPSLSPCSWQGLACLTLEPPMIGNCFPKLVLSSLQLGFSNEECEHVRSLKTSISQLQVSKVLVLTVRIYLISALVASVSFWGLQWSNNGRLHLLAYSYGRSSVYYIKQP